MPTTRTITVLNQDPDTCRELAEILAEHNIIVMNQQSAFLQLERLVLSDMYDTYCFKYEHVLKLNASGSHTMVYTTNDNHYAPQILFSKNLKEVQEMLPSEIFLRISDSWIVNIFHVEKLCKKDERCLILSDDSKVHISDRYFPAVKKVLNALGCKK